MSTCKACRNKKCQCGKAKRKTISETHKLPVMRMVKHPDGTVTIEPPLISGEWGVVK